MSQMIAAMIVMVVVVAIIVPIIGSSWDQIISNSVSIADLQQMQMTQNGQTINLISIVQNTGELSLDMINVGIYEISINRVLIDGVATTYTLTDQSLNTITTIPLNEIVILEAAGTGTTVQIITESGKLFEFSL